MTLTLENVSKVVGHETHIDNVSLQFEAGRLNVLLGAGGSGKTSLLRLIAGLDPISSGRIVFNGNDITRRPVKRRNVAVVYQEFVNYPSLTVFENIASPLRVQRCEQEEIIRRVTAIATRLHIEDLLQRIPAQLSGGQQQRVAIARALIKDADIVLMDEPLASLDYKLREQLRRELPDLIASLSTVAIYATTDPMEALLLGGSTAVLHQGNVCQFGETAKVYREPATEICAQLFSDPPLNLIDVFIADGHCKLHDGRVLPVGSHMQELDSGPYRVGIRGEQLKFQSQGSGHVAISATVNATEMTGSETIVHIEAAGERWVVIAEGTIEFAANQSVDVFFDPNQFLVFNSRGATAALPARS